MGPVLEMALEGDKEETERKKLGGAKKTSCVT
jgi:hypothetical protein